METGKAIPYALDKLQDRGRFFVNPGEDIYTGQVVGESTKEGDIVLNLTKMKKQSDLVFLRRGKTSPLRGHFSSRSRSGAERRE